MCVYIYIYIYPRIIFVDVSETHSVVIFLLILINISVINHGIQYLSLCFVRNGKTLYHFNNARSVQHCIFVELYWFILHLSEIAWASCILNSSAAVLSVHRLVNANKERTKSYWPRAYPKKYAHGLCFAVLCCGYTLTDFPISIRLTSLALWQSNDCPSASKATLMNMDKYFMWIHYEWLHNHNKAKHNKTVCIFLGIYCISLTNFLNYLFTTYRISFTYTVVTIEWCIFPMQKYIMYSSHIRCIKHTSPIKGLGGLKQVFTLI